MLALAFVIELGVCTFLTRATAVTVDEPSPKADPGTYSGSWIQLTPLLVLELPMESGGICCLACARDMSAMLALARDEGPPKSRLGPSMEVFLDESPFDSSWSLCFPKKLF
jgi:hypothetical protein